MWEHVKALEDRNPVDQLACLVLRVLSEFAPCTERLLVECVSAGDPRSQPGQASFSHTLALVRSALLKLKALALIEVAEERIAITAEGKRCLKSLPVVTLQQRSRSAAAKDTEADRQVATDCGEQDADRETTKVEVTQPSVSSLSQLPGRPWTRYSALLMVLATALRAEYAPRLKRFCQEHLTQVGVAMPRVCKTTIGGAWDTSLYIWKRKVAPMISSGAIVLVHVLVQLANAFSRAWKAVRLFEGTGEGKIGARLLKFPGANWMLPDVKLAGFDLSRSTHCAGALLIACGALSIAGGVVFLCSESANSSRAEGAFLSDKRAGNPRASPIVWLHDGQDRLGRSIFVTRRLAGTAWIEGLAIRGENASGKTLTGLQGAIKTDSGDEIKLDINTEGSQGKWADAADVPSGSKFTLRSALEPDGAQKGIPDEEFLSKYGGMIFRVSYVVAGVQTTLIEYFSTSKLRAQLADVN